MASLLIIVAGWMVLNVSLPRIGLQAVDAPPFGWLELAISLAALLIAVLILSTQRRDDELASHREKLTLELAILSDQKAAKIIELLEEIRRDSPTLRDRVDHEAESMSSPADPQAVSDAIKTSPEEPQPGT